MNERTTPLCIYIIHSCWVGLLSLNYTAVKLNCNYSSWSYLTIVNTTHNLIFLPVLIWIIHILWRFLMSRVSMIYKKKFTYYVISIIPRVPCNVQTIHYFPKNFYFPVFLSQIQKCVLCSLANIDSKIFKTNFVRTLHNTTNA